MGHHIENETKNEFNDTLELLTKITSIMISQTYPDKVVICYQDNKTNKLKFSIDINNTIKYILTNNINTAYIQYSIKKDNKINIIPLIFNPSPLLSYEEREVELLNIVRTVYAKN